MKTTHEKIVHAEAMSARWLADGNEALESGKREKAERCYEKSQYWLDRANNLRGWGADRESSQRA